MEMNNSDGTSGKLLCFKNIKTFGAAYAWQLSLYV